MHHAENVNAVDQALKIYVRISRTYDKFTPHLCEFIFARALRQRKIQGADVLISDELVIWDKGCSIFEDLSLFIHQLLLHTNWLQRCF